MHLLSTMQYRSIEQLEQLFLRADQIRGEANWQVAKPLLPLSDKALAIIKDEGSTRTRVSFEIAMKRLGGLVTILDLDKRSSIVKGESLEDTVRTMSEYVDVIAMRHSEKGMVQRASNYSLVPVINAGDGDGEHPTQALLDAYTIRREVGRVSGVHIMMVGDMKCSRTVHSLINLLSLYPDVYLYFCSPPHMDLPDEYRRSLRKSNLVEGDIFTEMLRQFGHKLDVLYMTRLQRERRPSSWDKSVAADLTSYYNTLTDEEARLLAPKTTVRHPLPRNEDIPVAFDKDSRAVYFPQAKNGMFIRMALLNNFFTTGTFIP